MEIETVAQTAAMWGRRLAALTVDQTVLQMVELMVEHWVARRAASLESLTAGR